MGNLKVFLMGPFEASLDDQALDRFDTSKTRALLAYLAAERSHVQRRDFLAELLWPGQPDVDALRNLRLTIFRLRQSLASAVSEGEPAEILLFPDRQHIEVNPRAGIWTDLGAFTDLLTQVGQHTHTHIDQCFACMQLLSQAVEYYRGEFLEGFSLKNVSDFDDWLTLRRQQIAQQVIDSLDHLGEHFWWQASQASIPGERERVLEKSRHYSQQALRIEPWHESAHRRIMQINAVQGQMQEALEQYQICRQALMSELAVSPDSVTQALYHQIVDRRFDSWPVRPAAAALPPARRHNLPPELTPLIGRDAQLARLQRLLFSYRWVSLVGEGGVGKTRLALAAAEKVIDRYEDGAWLVQLAERGIDAGSGPSSRDVQSFLAGEIARVVGLRHGPEGSMVDALIDYLRGKKLLLILDSFEQFSTGASFLIDLLVNAPGVHIMVTSRQTLHFRAGYVMHVEGLEVPESVDDPEAAMVGSVRLFLERVERLSGSLQLTPHNLALITMICRMLDGIPLAIELAAPWAIKKTLEEIERAIRSDLDFLSTTMAGIEDRHRSMRAVFESSWRLLNQQERKSLLGCASLAGEFDMQAAIRASQASPPVVESLIDKFLIARVSPGRYRIHETLRQFAAEKMEMAMMSSQ